MPGLLFRFLPFPFVMGTANALQFFNGYTYGKNPLVFLLLYIPVGVFLYWLEFDVSALSIVTLALCSTPINLS